MNTTVIRPTSPDEALYVGLHRLSQSHIYTPSRNGDVVRFPGVTITEWADPTQRISWSPVRDANPFLHYIEAFWMLAGRNDVALVAKLAANMQNYSDDGTTLFGAYGHRWRRHFGHDQIAKIIKELKVNPTSRRCVLQMWDGALELDRGIQGGRDLCCNHAISFDPCNGVLNMTVSNRSNDMVLGAYGANVVHMSILHEYVATMTGLKLGTYSQVSSNMHFYLTLNPLMEKLANYKDGQLNVSGLGVDFVQSAKLQESLFTDLPNSGMADPEFVYVINSALDAFLRGEQVGGGIDVRSLSLLAILCDAFTIFKNPNENGGAVNAVAFLQSHELKSLWIDNAVGWLKRRASYRERVASAAQQSEGAINQ